MNLLRKRAGLPKLFLAFLIVPLFLSAQLENAKTFSHDDINEIIKKVSLGNKSSIDQLMAISLGDHPITLTQDIVKVVVFGLIRTNQQAKLSEYLKKVDPGLTSFLNEKKVNTGCKMCEGEGELETKCAKCVFGKCANCKGTGYIEYKALKGASKDDGSKKTKSICNTCHATGKCLKCKGEGKLEQDCPHCKSGNVLDRNSIQKEMIKSIQNITKESSVNLSMKNESDVKNNEELANLFNKSVKKSVEQTENSGTSPIEESGIQKAFQKTKAYIEGYESKTSKKICNDITLSFVDKVPTLVLDLADSYIQKITSNEVREVSGFKKYWEDQAVINGYDKEVATILMNKGININDKFKLIEKYKRVK